MRYGLHEIDKHHVVATTVAADRDEALVWFSEKLRLMLTFEGDPVAADYLLDERPENLPYMAHTPNPTIPAFCSQRSSCTPSGITRRWSWSDRCLSLDRFKLKPSNTGRGRRLHGCGRPRRSHVFLGEQLR
jgi:hypothetical protein